MPEKPGKQRNKKSNITTNPRFRPGAFSSEVRR
jgi:hypothetical protein